MSSTNPLLGMAVYSLANALELYQSNEPNNAERRRFGAIILMDLSVEYILKAKLYQLDQNEFMKKQQDLGFSDCINDDRIVFLEGIVPHTGQTNASRYVFAKLVSEFKKVLKMGQHSIKIKRGEVMCGRKVLLAIGERGTALNLDLINEKCLRLFCLKA